MLKQVLGYPSNISVKLAMSLFDKQISPILLYDSPIWGLADNNRHIYLHVSSIDKRVKNQVQTLLNNTLGREVIIDESRAFRDKNKILVKLHNIIDKLDLLNTRNDSCHFRIMDHEITQKIKYDLPHSKYCKFALGVSKYASTTGVYNEINRYPLQIKAHTQAISYWHRLETGQNGDLLQNAYIECKDNAHPFFQNLIYLLYKNGLGYLIMTPNTYSTKQVAKKD